MLQDIHCTFARLLDAVSHDGATIAVISLTAFPEEMLKSSEFVGFLKSRTHVCKLFMKTSKRTLELIPYYEIGRPLLKYAPLLFLMCDITDDVPSPDKARQYASSTSALR